MTPRHENLPQLFLYAAGAYYSGECPTASETRRRGVKRIALTVLAGLGVGVLLSSGTDDQSIVDCVRANVENPSAQAPNVLYAAADTCADQSGIEITTPLLDAVVDKVLSDRP